MNSQIMPWRADDTGDAARVGTRDPSENLRRVGRGQAGLWESFHTLSQSQEDQARQAADLLERETWALTGILGASDAIWPYLTGPTLHFALERAGDAGECHVELGRFAHLDALAAPSTDEQALVGTVAPCFARVRSNPERQAAGHDGALAYSYAPMPVGEAVAAIGFAKILAGIETATRRAGQVLLDEAEAQSERQELLLRVERMFGWAPEPAAEVVAPPIGSRVAMVLVRQADRHWLVTAGASFGLVAALSGLLLSTYYTVLGLILLSVVVVICRLTVHSGA